MNNNEIIKQVIEDFKEKHKRNLDVVGGWDNNDFLEYSKEVIENAIKLKEQEFIKKLNELKKVNCVNMPKEFIAGSNWCNDLWIDKIEKECKFETLKNGRIYCKTHNQDLIYIFSTGEKICQIGEEELVSQLGGLHKYIKWRNDKKRFKMIKEILCEEIRMERFAYGQGYKKACDELEKDINDRVKEELKKSLGGKE